MRTITTCTRCSKDIVFSNDLYTDKDSKSVCGTCVESTPGELFSADINKYTIGYEKDSVVVWVTRKTNKVESLWLQNGSHSIPVTDEIKERDWKEVLEGLIIEVKSGISHCTACNKTCTNDELNWTNFAGHVCSECYDEFQENVKSEKARGHVCSMCGTPYSKCCC
jgi:hypothetical protein